MGLELRESLGPLAQTLVLLGSVVGDLPRGWPIAESAIVGQRGVAIALAAKRKRLVLDHGLQPRHELVLARGGCLAQEDLEAALVGVLGVLRGGGVAAGGGEDLCAVPGDECGRSSVDLTTTGGLHRG